MENNKKILSVDVYYMHIPTQTSLDILKTHVNDASARKRASCAFALTSKCFLAVCSKEAQPSHSPSQHLLTSTYTHTHSVAHTHTHPAKWQVESNDVALEVLAQYFRHHEVWNSRQCRTPVKKTRFFMRRSLKKYWKSLPFGVCAAKIRFLMVRLRLRKYGDFPVSVTVHAILATWCRGAQ